jgi:hypothetical protein
MALLDRDSIIAALQRIGELAAADGEEVRLIAVGGAAMVLGFKARLSTRDVDVLIVAPSDTGRVRMWARKVADELGWPQDWLNDAAKGFLVGLSKGPELLRAPGIEVWRPANEQLLAMKLAAWRDDVDIGDARRLLEEFHEVESKEQIWKQVEVFLPPGSELKSQYAFDDLWNSSRDCGGDAGKGGAQ